MLAALLSACGGQSSASQRATELDTVASWAATAQMVGEAWRGGNVPTAYARQTLQAAQQALRKEGDTLAQPDMADAHTTTIQEYMRTIEQAIDQIAADVDRDDRAGVDQPVARLAQVEQAISDLAKQAEVQQ